MATLRAAFERRRRAGGRALIPFVMGGDPDLGTTGALVRALDDAGADVIEVGIPFSDPLADGPVIQASSTRALRAGTTPEQVLALLRRTTPGLRAPVVILTYWNPVLQFGGGRGPAAFLRAARASGVAGLVVPDLPTEEGRALQRAARRAGVATVFLAAPTSPRARLRAIARASTGFIYYVSVTGTTGARRHLPPELRRGVRQVKRFTRKPVCVGFGISTPAQARAVGRMADGVIVGSALIRALEAARTRAARVAAARRFVSSLRRVL